MWVPVLESAQLKANPARVMYWGSPVVVFRTASGRLGALEDVCGHRGIPLSRGSIRGEEIRCGFHHFRFDTDGDCVHIPEIFGADQMFRRSCGVRRFFIREEVGLIWISVEDEPEAEFPVDIGVLPEHRITATGSFDVDGDLRVWLDHFLDLAHVVWTHAETTYYGSPERAAALASVSLGIRPDSRYPVRPAVEATIHVEDEGGAVRYALPMRALVAAARVRNRVRRPLRSGRSAHLSARADLVTPLCQETRIRVGSMPVLFWTSINPLSANKNRFTYSLVADAGHRGPVGRAIGRRLLHDLIRHHLGVEDGNLLATARYLDSDRLRATELDATVLAMREMFTAYQREKGKLYPDDSLIHTIHYGDGSP